MLTERFTALLARTENPLLVVWQPAIRPSSPEAHPWQRTHRPGNGPSCNQACCRGFGLTFGFTTFFLSAIVLIPLAALISMAASSSWHEFVHTVASERALASYRLSFGASLLAATINLVFGFILAWTLVRYDFPGRKLVDALIDLPFALPTAVSGIALTTVFAQNGWLGHYLQLAGIKVAYTWIGVTIAPDADRHAVHGAHRPAGLAEVQRDLEDAAEILGANRFYVFGRIILPIVVPAMLTGFALAFARGVGEYGSVIFIAGNLPFKTEITPLLIVIRLDEFDNHGAAALGCVMLSISFLGLWAINFLQSWGRRRFTAGPLDGRRCLTGCAGGAALPSWPRFAARQCDALAADRHLNAVSGRVADRAIDNRIRRGICQGHPRLSVGLS